MSNFVSLLRTAQTPFTRLQKRALKPTCTNVFIDATKLQANCEPASSAKKFSFCEHLTGLRNESYLSVSKACFSAVFVRIDTSKTGPFDDVNRSATKLQNELKVWKNGFMFVEKLSKRCCITTWVLYKYSD
jgi:hypothetical protein